MARGLRRPSRAGARRRRLRAARASVRRHPTRSGTRTSPCSCSSGSSRMIQPPGPSLPLAAIERSIKLAAERRRGASVQRCRSRQRDEGAVDDLRDAVGGNGEELLVRGTSLGRTTHGEIVASAPATCRRKRQTTMSSAGLAQRARTARLCGLLGCVREVVPVGEVGEQARVRRLPRDTRDRSLVFHVRAARRQLEAVVERAKKRAQAG